MSADFTPEKEDYKILTPFKMQVLTNFPYIEADFDALTNYQLLCKIVEYLNGVIHNENEITEQVNSLYNAYVSLQNYVNDYFDNLDVQEEINKKLDEMAEDGSLTQLIKNYVDPIYQSYESRINDEINTQNTKINALESGSPLVASSVSGMTDTTRVYVNTSNGYWYYYNGEEWTQGGVYQATGIDPDDPVIVNITNDLEDIRTEYLNTDIDDYSQGVYNENTGEAISSNYGCRVSTAYALPKGIYKFIVSHGTYRVRIFIYDSDGNLRTLSPWYSSDFLFFMNNGDTIKYHIGYRNGNTLLIANLNLDKLSIIQVDKLINKENFGYGTLSGSGILQKSSIRIVSDYIEVEAPKYYTGTFNNTRYEIILAQYDENKTYITQSLYLTNTPIQQLTNFKTKYIRILVKPKVENDFLDPDDLLLDIYPIRNNFTYDNNVFTSITWSQGSINNSGEDTTNTIRLRTDFIPINSECYYNLRVPNNPSMQVLCVRYDKSKNYLGKAFEYTTTEKTINGFEGYLRFVMNRYPSDDTTILPSEASTSGYRLERLLSANANAERSKKLTVMTNNVGHWSYGTNNGYDGDDADEQIENWINHFNSDNSSIIGLQEYYPYFDRNKTTQTSSVIINKVSNKIFTGMRDQALLSTELIKDIVEIPLGTSSETQSTWRSCLKGSLMINDLPVSVYVVHLVAGDAVAHAAQVSELITMLQNESTFICFGDFNIESSSGYDPFKAVNFNLANCGEFGVFNTYIYDDYPLDNIITSSNVSIVSAKMLDDAITSDHKAIVAEIIVPNKIK